MRKLLSVIALLLALVLLLAACEEEPPVTNNPPAQNQTTQTPPAQDPPTQQTPPDENPPAQKSFEELSAKEQAFYLLHYEPLRDAELSSYTSDINLTLSGTAYGFATTVTSQGKLTACRLDANDLFYLENSTNTIHMSNGSQSQTITQTLKEGYANGKMFSYYHDNTGEGDYALYSTLSVAEYLAHKQKMQDGTSLDDLTASDCTTVTCRKIAGGYKAEFSGFNAAGLNKLSDMWEGLTDILGAQVADVHLTLSVDEALMPKSMQMEFSFGLAATPTQMQLNATYSGFNTTLPTALNLSSFEQITDLRSVDLVKKALSDAENAENLSFDLVGSFEGEGIGTSVQESTVKIETQDGAYSFRVDETIDDILRVTRYASGVITQTTNGSPVQQELTQAQAREWVLAYIKPVSIDLATVHDAALQSGTHRIQISPADPSYFVRMLSAYGVDEEDVLSPRAILEVKLNADGSLRSLDYLLEAQILIGSTTYDATYRIQCSNYDFS